jgi:hypothetical protein
MDLDAPLKSMFSFESSMERMGDCLIIHRKESLSQSGKTLSKQVHDSARPRQQKAPYRRVKRRQCTLVILSHARLPVPTRPRTFTLAPCQQVIKLMSGEIIPQARGNVTD